MHLEARTRCPGIVWPLHCCCRQTCDGRAASSMASPSSSQAANVDQSAGVRGSNSSTTRSTRRQPEPAVPARIGPHTRRLPSIAIAAARQSPDTGQAAQVARRAATLGDREVSPRSTIQRSAPSPAHDACDHQRGGSGTVGNGRPPCPSSVVVEVDVSIRPACCNTWTVRTIHTGRPDYGA